MAQLAFFSMVASLSFMASALLALRGMPSQVPMTAAAIVSAAIFGAIFAICRRREGAEFKETPRRQETVPAAQAVEEHELVGAG